MQMQPHDERAERAALAVLLTDPFSVQRARLMVGVNDFHLEPHKHIAQAAYALGYRCAIDTVEARLRHDGTLGELPGGAGYLAELAAHYVSSAGLDVHCAAIVNARKQRDTLQLCGQVASDAMRKGGSVDEAIQLAAAKFAALSQSSSLGTLTLEQVAANVIARFDAKANGTWRADLVRTGVPALDMLAALEPGTLVTVAGRPGAGKSVLMQQIALHAVRAKQRSLVLSFEMPAEQVLQRMAQSLSGVGWASGAENRIPPPERERFRDALRQLVSLPLAIDSSSASVAYAVARAEAMASESLRLVVVDYVQIMTADSSMVGKGATRDREISAITSALKQLAMRLNVTVVMGSQFSRAADGVEPTLGMFRESGGIENDSDIAIAIHQPMDDTTGKPHTSARDIIVLKNREGESGRKVFVNFDGARKRIVPTAEQGEEL